MSFAPASRSFLPCRLFRATPLLLRRGKPRPRAGMFPDKYRRVPALLKPLQGGQQYFNDFRMRQANEEAMQRLAVEDEHGGAVGGEGIGGRRRAGGMDHALQRGEVGEGGEGERLFGLNPAMDDGTEDLLAPKLPQMDFLNALHDASPVAIEEEMRRLRAQDSFYHPTTRSFNERQWYEDETRRLQEVYLQKRADALRQRSEKEKKKTAGGDSADGTSALASPEATLSMAGAEAPEGWSNARKNTNDEDGGGGGRIEEDKEERVEGTPLSSRSSSRVPERILSGDYFQHRYGFSLMRRTHTPHPPPSHGLPPHLKGHPDAALEQMSPSQRGGGDTGLHASGGITAYSQLDLWAELPRYDREMIFLYLISRRRNTYAVAYDYDGKRFIHPYTAGNRGLKGGDRGFRGDGSTDNGHQVTSAYLNDLIPKIRERRAEQNLPPLQRGDKVDLVVRVMGFYNGRQGAVRAVQDRQAEFRVRYLEDITPFPLNGPKMPRGVFH